MNETANRSGLSDEEIYALADALRDTDWPLERGLSSEGLRVKSEWALVDDLREVAQLEQCGNCGFWWASMELDGDGLCPDCAPEQDEE